MLDLRVVAATLCVSAILTGPSAHADTVVRTSEPLNAPHQPTRETVLLADGQPAAVVLIPEDDAFARVAADLNAALQAKLGVALPTMPEREYMAAATDARTVIVVGNYATGPLALRLYANKLIVSDGHYPGATGYELRTIPDALDMGVNVLFVGASNAEVAAEGIKRLLELLDARGIAVTTWEGWRNLDAAERSLGEAEGRERKKIVEWDEMIASSQPES